MRNGQRDCFCNEGYIGDGRHGCKVPQRDCHDLQTYHNVSQSGVYRGTLGLWAGMEFIRAARCDMKTADGHSLYFCFLSGGEYRLEYSHNVDWNGAAKSLVIPFFLGALSFHVSIVRSATNENANVHKRVMSGNDSLI